MSSKQKIQSLIDARDMEGLIRALRHPTNPETRAQAAKGLAILQDVSAAQSLIRSTLEDPDETVRKAASLALTELLGSQIAKNALDAFSLSSPDEHPWVTEQDPPITEAGTTDWRLEDIEGLIAVLTNEPSSELKLKAIRALRDVHNTHALDVLAMTALWDEDNRVQQAARETLEGFYGDELPTVLESFRLSEADQEEEEEEFEEDLNTLQGMEEPPSSSYHPLQRQNKTSLSPTIQEDDPARKFLLLLAILVILAGIFFLVISR
ncbi:MAG: HEAT repeat domain-containing protein [Anaerolineae bacterium]|nr:HEAT repeat domain-containing protein [Anaerolineae bacterium]